MAVFYIILIFIIGFFLASRTAKQLKNTLPYWLFIEHMFFSFFYFLFAQTTSADANYYFGRGSINQEYIISLFGTGTDFIVFLSAFFQKLGFDKLSLFFLFGLFGYIGFIYLLKMLPKIPNKFFGFYLYNIILLLPGFHFWTSALGKDSLFFMGLMLFFFSTQKLPSRFLLMIFSFFLLAAIRPHMGFIIIVSSLLAIFFRTPSKYKFSHFIIGMIAIIVLIYFFPFLMEFLNIKEMQPEEINRRFESFTEFGAKMSDGTSSYVDMSNSSIPTKLFAYLFRPLFFDVHSFLQLAASFENAFLLLLIFSWLKTIKFNIFKWYNRFNISMKIMAIYFIVGWLILSMGMYNLGLASRQKYMLIPVFFILITNVYYFFFIFQNKNNKPSKK